MEKIIKIIDMERFLETKIVKNNSDYGGVEKWE